MACCSNKGNECNNEVSSLNNGALITIVLYILLVIVLSSAMGRC
jgi:hypothetical protein